MYFHPIGQTVDTWATLLEKGHLTPEREQAFLTLLQNQSAFAAGAQDAALVQTSDDDDRQHDERGPYQRRLKITRC